MNDLEKLHTDLIGAEENYSVCMVNAQQKTEELNNLKVELSNLKDRLVKVSGLLSNAKKGIGISLSTDELIALKKELSEASGRIDDLSELIPMVQNTINNMNSGNVYASRHIRTIKDQITNIIADKAAEEVVSLSSTKLKELTHTSMSLYGYSFTGNAENINDLYKRIGERLCKQLFNNENDSLVLPTIQQSLAERDGMLEKLA